MFNINYQKYKKPDLNIMATQVPPHPIYQPFDLDNFQAFNPIFTRFFSMTDDNYNLISLNNPYQAIDLWTVQDSNGQNKDARVFVKFSPLIDPIKFMTGRYNLSDPTIYALPNLSLSNVSPKIAGINNCAYTDCFFSYLSSMFGNTHDFLHSVHFYGSALAVQKTFRFNLNDDLDYLKTSEFFVNSIGSHILLDKTTEYLLNSEIGTRDWSRAHREKIQISDNADDIELDFDTFDNITQVSEANLDNGSAEDGFVEDGSVEDGSSENGSVEDGSSENGSVEDGSSEDGSEDVHLQHSDSDSSLSSKSDTTGSEQSVSSWETTSSDDDNASYEDEYDNQINAYCYLKNMPVQLIFQEQCKGTLDDLILFNNISATEIVAALMQITCILYVYNNCFQFTHNDLHTSNIMFVETDKEYLYYKIQGKYFKIPTYGRIYKLIDFGRAIYKYQGKTFCSDSFAMGGDAYSQYNCEPFFNDQKPRIEPNYSFDLCRLGCSLYDIINASDDTDDKDEQLLYDIINKWCTDDEGKNILYKKNGQERYPDFKLYKMIARTVHNHTAKLQLVGNNATFDLYLCDNTPDITFFDLDALPKYV